MQGILLAAGFGRRFQTGANTEQDKLLASLPNQQSILFQSATRLIQALPNSIAVIQPQQIARKKILQALGFNVIESLRAKEGMGYALADAVQASQDADGWLVALADMPWITTELIQQLCAGVTDGAAIVAPRFKGKRGQPVAFGATWKNALADLTGDVGARAILQTAEIGWVDWHDASIHQDVDVSSDLVG